MTRGAGWWLALLVSCLGGCGTVGPPVAPEDVGIGPLMERQDKARSQAAGQPAPLDSTQKEGTELPEFVGQDEELPSLKPVSGR